MEDIIKSITEAEERAAKIKEQALSEAEGIAARASEEAALIAQRSESEIRLYREKAVKKAETDGEKAYNDALERKKAEAKAYADGIIKNTDGTVLEIVRRVTRGSR